MNNLFRELIQLSVGTKVGLSRVLTVHEWIGVYSEAEKQAVVGVMLDGLEKLSPAQRPQQDILLQWIGTAQIIEQTYSIHRKRARELSDRFRTSSFKACVLKGVGIAQYYPNPQRRQCGDIDIWVINASGKKVKDSRFRKSLIEFLQNHGDIGPIDVKHCDWKIFENTEIEVHFIPTWFYNPFANSLLQKWLEEQKDTQFANLTKLGFCTPTTAFNLVYVLIHIYRHLFDEGVGLRQLVDFYYVLKHSTVEERGEAMRVLSTFWMKRFVGATMYVMREVFGIVDSFLLCQPLQKEGEFLLTEVMRAGNLGHYDERNKHHPSRWVNGWQNVRRDLRFVWRYPQEVCWMPAWKVWHWCWRKSKGYL